MTTIKLYCHGSMARAKVEGQLTHAMAGIPVEIQWDEVWNGLTKTMKLRCNDVCRTAIVAEDGTAVVPYECLIAGQRLEIGLDGWSQDGTLRIPSSWASCGIVKQSVAKAEGAPPTMDTMTKLLTMLEKAEEAAKETEQSAGAAAGYASAAAGSAGAAAGYAAEADKAAKAAKESEDAAAGSAAAADKSEKNAADHEASAGRSAEQAAKSFAGSLDAERRSKDAANGAAQSLIGANAAASEAQRYSAKAKDFANTAAGYAGAATVSIGWDADGYFSIFEQEE